MNRYLGIYALTLAGLIAFFALSRPAKKPDLSKKIWRIAVNPTFPPFTYIQEGKIAGFDIDLMNAIAQETNAEIQWESLPFDALLPGLQTGITHMAVGGITPTPERKQKVLFSKSYHEGDPLVIVALASNSCHKTIDDLKGKVVVVNEGFNADFYMSAFPEITLLRLETPEESFLALKAGRADAFVAAHDSIMPFLHKYGIENYCINAIPDTNDSAAICISKQHSSLLYEIDAALDKLAQSGVIEQLKQKWKLS